MRVHPVNLPPTLFGLAWPVALAIDACFFFIIAWMAPRGRVGAWIATVLSCGAFLLPLLVEAKPRIARAVIAFVGVLCVMRVVDLLRGARFDTFARRLAFVVSLVDTRRKVAVPPTLDWPRIGTTIAYGAS